MGDEVSLIDKQRRGQDRMGAGKIVEGRRIHVFLFCTTAAELGQSTTMSILLAVGSEFQTSTATSLDSLRWWLIITVSESYGGRRCSLAKKAVGKFLRTIHVSWLGL